MTVYWFSVGLVFLLALGLSIALVRLAQWIAPRVGLVSYPGGRRKHARAMPQLGSLPLWGAFTVACLVAYLLPVERGDANEPIRLFGLIGGGTVIFLFGLLDDKFDLPWYIQIFGQAATAGIAFACLIFIERFNNPLTGETVILPAAITFILTTFWLVLMMNTVNFLDGVDGLAGGVILIAAVLLFLHAYRPDAYGQQQLSVSLLPVALAGAILGFLIFNWHPAKIFMGSGAVYMGYTLGALSIIGGAKMATILLVMGLPLLDVAWQASRRLITGHNPMKGDRGHVHFRLVDARVSARQICYVYYSVCAAFGVIALITTSRQFKLIALIVMVGVIFAGFSFVVRLGLRRAEGQTEEAG